MLSVIIPTLDSERALVPTLTALVPGATAGLITEVLVVDGGSRDETAAVADAGGCNFLVAKGPLGRRFKTATVWARAPWLFFLRPGTVLDAPWTDEATRFVEQSWSNGCAAAFRRSPPARPTLHDRFSTIAAAFGAKPRPEQGLIVSKWFYEQIGGHSESAADPEAELIRRIGRRRIVILAASAFHAS